MLPAFARRPLTQSPRLRFLAVRPGCRVPHRFSSTEADVAPSSDGKAAVTADASAEPDYPEKHFSKANNKPVFSDGSDFALLSKEYAIMTKKHGWTLDSQKRGIRKIYQFSSYTKCLDFVNLVGINSKAKRHHPAMYINPNQSVTVRWATHVPPGLSEKDILMAKLTDELATLLGGSELIFKKIWTDSKPVSHEGQEVHAAQQAQAEHDSYTEQEVPAEQEAKRD